MSTAEVFREAMEAYDLDGLIATLAAGFTLRSPVTGRIAVHGPEEMRELMTPHLAVVQNVRYFADVGDEHSRAQFYRATVGGLYAEVATRLELDDEGKVRDVTVYVRPLPALVAMAAGLVVPIARGRHGAFRAFVARLMTSSLAWVTRLGDRCVTWFA
ncbi:MAG TPA: hypothetical protein VHX88_08385 [Solirubrobacteraceae bacterium]|jgi:hypothetical protein|nr:hypothetical protein [Solirubrobacteraceae bacterium]